MHERGQIIQNRYQLETPLSDNQIRPTWLAKDLQARDPNLALVVLKLLSLGGQVQWEHLKLFEREAEILKNLDHPQIPKYRDYFAVDDRSLWFGLVQDYIRGSSLKQLLTQKQRFTLVKVKFIATQILQILIYLHELNPPLVHRDIKPSNILLGEDNKIYLLDFGSVQDKAIDRRGTFTVVGTYGYTPMEQFGGKAVASSDLYALGATLIHLLTGIAPSELPQKDLKLQYRDYLTIAPYFATWLDRLIEPALEKRFKSAREAIKELQAGPKINKYNLSKEAKTALVNNNSGCGLFANEPVPREITGWNWGAFVFPLFWAFPNEVWLGILSLTPGIGWIVALLMGSKGNEWAWKSRRWDSIEQFKRHQRGWAIAILGAPFITIFFAFIPALIGINSSTVLVLAGIPFVWLVYYFYQQNNR